MRTSFICAIFVLAAAPAIAQTEWEGRVRIGVSGGGQLDTMRLNESIVLTKNVEPAPLTTSQANKTLPLVDAGATFRLNGNLGAGVSLSVLSGTAGAAVSAQIPHPFLFNQPRTVTGLASNVTHREVAAHTDLAYVIVSDRIDLALSTGASFFRVDQDLVSDILYTESYPYDTATFASAPTKRVTATKVGYNVGADATWKLSPRWGVGGLLRFARARVPLSVNGLDAGTVNAGGLQLGVGLRVMF